MYHCRHCQKKGKNFKTPLGTYGRAIMKQHIDTEHPNRFICKGEVVPLFGNRKKGDDMSGSSDQAKKTKRINDSTRAQRHKNTLSKQKQTKRDGDK